MSASQFEEFDRRMRRISRRHSKLSQGYVTSVNSDGLVVAKPKRRSNRSTLRGVAMVIIVLVAFKGFLHSQIGSAAYAERVDALSQGSAIEKGGAFVMVADPLTLWLSQKFSSLVR